VRPLTSYARTKAKAETIVLDARNGEGKPIGVVVRLAAVYGPRVKGNYLSLVRAIARRRFWPIGPGSNRRSLLFEDDAGRVAVHLARDPRAPGGIFNATDGELHTVTEIIEAIYNAAGRRKPRIHFPLALAYVMLGAVEIVFRMLGRRPPVGRFTLAKYTEEIAVASDRLAALGFSPLWTMEKGWRETVRRLRARDVID
jgi:UDP-glucose 4-epimerase